MLYLTTDEHRKVVERLLAMLASHKGVRPHTAGFEYTSLMVCFMLHSKGAAESLLVLHQRYGNDWFPATTGYLIVRSLFEVDVTAHYISLDPIGRSRRYIEYEHVIKKKTLEAVERHRVSKDSSWREGMQLTYNTEYAPKKAEIDRNYGRVRSKFEDAKGRRAKSWSGKNIYEMAKEVDHVEAYDIFYADLSNFAHVNVMLANKFLRLKPDSPTWTQRADEFDVASVFQYAAIFLDCFLRLFGKQFGLWKNADVDACWNFPEAEGRCPK